MLDECFYCKRYDICWDLKDNNIRCYSCAKKDDPKEIEDFWNRIGIPYRKQFEFESPENIKGK